MERKYTNAAIKRRITVSALEVACEALLVSVFLNVLPDSYASSLLGLIKNLALGFFATLTFFITTGYLLTTAIADWLCRTKNVWLYPVIVSMLFLIHLKILLWGAGSLPPSLSPLRILGPCIAFACTFVGSYFLAKRKTDGGPLSSAQKGS